MVAMTQNNNFSSGSSDLKGAIAALGSNVFHIREKPSLAQFVKVRDAVGLHYGSNLQSAMHGLVVDGIDLPPIKPDLPSGCP